MKGPVDWTQVYRVLVESGADNIHLERSGEHCMLGAFDEAKKAIAAMHAANEAGLVGSVEHEENGGRHWWWARVRMKE